MKMRRTILLYGALFATVTVFSLSVLFLLDKAFKQDALLVEQRGGSLWHVSQLEIEYLRLAHYLDRIGLGDPTASHDVLDRRFDIFWSRFPHLLEGRNAATYKDIKGFRERVSGILESLKEMEGAFQSLRSGGRPAYAALRDRLAAFGPVLHQIVVETTHGIEWRNDDLRTLQRVFLIGLIGVIVGGIALVILLFREIHVANQLLRTAIETEAELREAKEKAEAHTRAKSAFLASMSHELRTPLNAILGFSRVIQEQTFGPLGNARYDDYVEDIRKSGEHLLGLIENVLDLSEAEAGKLELNETVVDMKITVNDALSFVEGKATAAGSSLTAEIENSMPALYADARMIKQILLNLLTNAIKFTPAGGRITVRAALIDTGGLEITVSDSGIGMNTATRDKAIEPFAQRGTPLHSGQPGTGLGLPLTKSLIELHGGTLHIDSTPRLGTDIRVRFPTERLRHNAANIAPSAGVSPPA